MRSWIYLLGAWLLFGSAQPVLAAPRQILMILTSNGQLYGSGKKTGTPMDALATMYVMFEDAGYGVVLASVNGGPAPIDPAGGKVESVYVKRFYASAHATGQLQNTLPLNEIKPENYAAVVLPGGHGALWDMAGNGEVKRILYGFAGAHKPIVLLDHAAIALLDMVGPGGTFVAGRRMTAFTKEEEVALGLDTAVPIFLDRSLAEAGAKLVRAKPFRPEAARDGYLITGQNPASAAAAAKLALQALGGH